MRQSPWEHQEFAQLSLSNVDQRFLPGTRQEVDFVESELALPTQAQVIDLGCGAGRHAIELARRGYQVLGIDISPLMLAEARKRAREAAAEVQFLQMNLANLVQELGQDSRFDAAICLCESGLGVLGGAEHDLRLLTAIHDLLKPEAGLVLTTLNSLRQYRHPGSVFDYVSSIVHWQGPSGQGELLHEDQRIYAPSELSMLLRLSGFSDVSVWGCSPGSFARQQLGLDDIEMMLVAKR